jgi:transcriptional regulator with XRE-family HTH domain
MDEFRKWLELLIKQRSLTETQVAKLLGVSQSSVNGWRREDGPVASIEVATRLAQLLGGDIRRTMNGEGAGSLRSSTLVDRTAQPRPLPDVTTGSLDFDSDPVYVREEMARLRARVHVLEEFQCLIARNMPEMPSDYAEAPAPSDAEKLRMKAARESLDARIKSLQK